jgi:hypothetical protein
MGVTTFTTADAAKEAGPAPTVIETGQTAGRVFINPETGKPGPPPDTSAPALTESTLQRLSRSSEGLNVRVLSDGTRIVDLQGRFQNMSAVKLDQHGDQHINCSHSLEHIEQTLTQTPPADSTEGSP